MSDLKDADGAGQVSPAETPQEAPNPAGAAANDADAEQQLPACIRKRVVELRRLIATHSADDDPDAQRRITVVMDAFITEVCERESHHHPL